MSSSSSSSSLATMLTSAADSFILAPSHSGPPRTAAAAAASTPTPKTTPLSSLSSLSSTVRDYTPFTGSDYDGLAKLLAAGVGRATLSDAVFEDGAVACVVRFAVAMTSAPEFEMARLALVLAPETAVGCVVRLVEKSPAVAVPLLGELVVSLYRGVPCVRHDMLAAVRDVAAGFAKSPARFNVDGVACLIGLLGAVIRGMAKDSPKIPLMYNMLLSLHLPNEMASDADALLAVYHRPLVFALLALIELDPDELGPPTVAALCGVSRLTGASPRLKFAAAARIWPSARTACSPKVVLLLAELESLMEKLDPLGFARVAPLVFRTLASSMASLYAQIAQRALQLWENDAFRTHMAAHIDTALATMVPIICGPIAEHWNPSVRKLGAAVLSILHGTASEATEAAVAAVASSDAPDYPSVLAKLLPALPPAAPDDEPAADPAATVASAAAAGKLSYFDFVFGKVLGEGPFSVVRYAKHVVKGSTFSEWRDYAVKIVDTRETPEWGHLARQEAAMLRTVAHPGIANLVAAFSDASGREYLVTEYCGRGDVFNLLVSQGSFGVEPAAYLAAVVVDVLEHLHGLGLVYGDLKPENVLITADGRAKVCDFGSTASAADLAANGVVDDGASPSGSKYDPARWGMTPEYLPAAVLSGAEPPSPSSDMYALGMFLYQLLVGRLPDLVYEAGAPSSNKRVGFGDAAALGDVFGTGAAARVDPTAQDLITTLLFSSSSVDAKTVKAHPLFQDIAWETLHSGEVPELGVAGVAGRASDPRFRRRKHSIMFQAMPSKFVFDGASYAEMEPIAEDLVGERDSSASGGGRGGTRHAVATAALTRRRPKIPRPARMGDTKRVKRLGGRLESVKEEGSFVNGLRLGPG